MTAPGWEKTILRIAAVDYSLSRKSIDFYVSGCRARCDGCHNPELWDPDQGEYATKEYLEMIKTTMVDKFPKLVENVMIYGGELLDKPDAYGALFLRDLHTIYGLPIWLFTRYEFPNIPAYVTQFCSFIKTGPYMKELTVEGRVEAGITLATSNQKIWQKGIDY